MFGAGDVTDRRRPVILHSIFPPTDLFFSFDSRDEYIIDNWWVPRVLEQLTERVQGGRAFRRRKTHQPKLCTLYY